MITCTVCGAENRDEARFCDACGTALAPAEAPREQRKTVTVLFCDVLGSTARAEQRDPEATRAVMARYFDTARVAIERHGGTVEKFIGDAVMAVFGVPQVGARRMQALIAAARGQADEAQARAREAVRIASGSDYVDERVEAFITLGEVLLATGDGDPTESLREAIAIAEQKGSTVLAEEARSLLSGRPTPA